MSFELNGNSNIPALALGIESLGYKVASPEKPLVEKKAFNAIIDVIILQASDSCHLIPLVFSNFFAKVC